MGYADDRTRAASPATINRVAAALDEIPAASNGELARATGLHVSTICRLMKYDPTLASASARRRQLRSTTPTRPHEVGKTLQQISDEAFWSQVRRSQAELVRLSL